MANPYEDYSTLPDWNSDAPEIDGATGWSTSDLNNLYNVFSDYMDVDHLPSKYNIADEDLIRSGLREDARAFGAAVETRQDKMLGDTIGAHKKMGKAGLARSGGGLRALAEMKDQYGEDIIGLRKNMEAQRTQAIADITERREKWKSGIESLYTRWVMSGTENLPSESEQSEIFCAMEGGTWTTTWEGGVQTGECI